MLSASPDPRWQLHMPIPTLLGVIAAAKGQVSLLSTTVLVQTSVGRVLLLWPRGSPAGKELTQGTKCSFPSRQNNPTAPSAEEQHHAPPGQAKASFSCQGSPAQLPPLSIWQL